MARPRTMRGVLCLLCIASASAGADVDYYPAQVRHHVELGLTLEGLGAAARSDTSTAPHAFGLARGTYRWIGKHNYYIATPVLGFDIAGGWASPSEPAYDLHLEAGIRAHMWLWSGNPHYVGFLVGVGRDAIGDAVPADWTMPIDAFYQVPLSNTKILGLRTGPRIALERALGWSTSLGLKLLGNSDSASAFWPRDIGLSVDVSYVAGTLFTGLSIGVSSRPHSNYWERW